MTDLPPSTHRRKSKFVMLTEIFGTKSRQKCNPEDSRVLLLLDNCASHVDFETVTKLNEMKIVLAFFFPPNSTHVLSPLDVGLYGTLEQRLSDTLTSSRELNYATTASWMGHALDHVFSPDNIESAFLATGFWDKDLS